ncbi:MAG: translation elongation factor-like protein [Candidatus Omnitrophica bacterium]|nr:translation elongation factor-like protein [Candidatus Omnitrophota bacterium]
MYKKPSFKVKKVLKKPKKKREEEIGIITHYFGKISVGVIKLKKPLRIGERIHIKGAHDDFIQTVNSMQLNHKDISYAPKGREIGIKVIQKVHPNDRVYKVEEKNTI